MSTDPLRAPRGGGEFGKEIEANEVDPWFLTQLNAALKSPLLTIPKPFETWMIDKVASSGFDLPISQIIGFSQFLAEYAIVETDETTSSGSFTNLATTGPSLTGLPAGVYLLLWGAGISNSSAGDGGLMGLSVNGAAASISEIARGASAITSVGRGIVKDLTSASNTITAKYRVVSAGTATFGQRWLIALKVANL